MLHHGFQTPRKQWKVLSSVSRCLEPVMKHEARVFDMSSQVRQKEIMQRHVFSGIALFP